MLIKRLSKYAAALAIVAGVAVGAPPMFSSMKGPGAACAAQHGCKTLSTLVEAVECCKTFCSGELESGCLDYVFGDGSDPAKNLAAFNSFTDVCSQMRLGLVPAARLQRMADSLACIACQYPDAKTSRRMLAVGQEIPLVAAAIKARHSEQGSVGTNK